MFLYALIIIIIIILHLTVYFRSMNSINLLYLLFCFLNNKIAIRISSYTIFNEELYSLSSHVISILYTKYFV